MPHSLHVNWARASEKSLPRDRGGRFVMASGVSAVAKSHPSGEFPVWSNAGDTRSHPTFVMMPHNGKGRFKMGYYVKFGGSDVGMAAHEQPFNTGRRTCRISVTPILPTHRCNLAPFNRFAGRVVANVHRVGEQEGVGSNQARMMGWDTIGVGRRRRQRNRSV